jgi:hypothetical protein
MALDRAYNAGMKNGVKPIMIAKCHVEDPEVEIAKWEWRVFWSDKNPPPAGFSNFSAIEGVDPEEIADEKNTDSYVLIPGSNTNIKLRDDSVSCKILAAKTVGLTGYQKKQTFEFPITSANFAFLTGISVEADIASDQDFIKVVLKHLPQAKIIIAEKERKIAKFRKPKKNKEGFKKMKAEFSSLEIDGRKFQTFCLESKHQKLLEATIEGLDVGKGRTMDYTEFLSLLASGDI